MPPSKPPFIAAPRLQIAALDGIRGLAVRLVRAAQLAHAWVSSPGHWKLIPSFNMSGQHALPENGKRIAEELEGARYPAAAKFTESLAWL